MIYPTIYRYNAPYRGPRDSREISNVLTSTAHDIEVLTAESNKQSATIQKNIAFATSASESCVSTFGTSGEIAGEIYSYEGVDKIRLKLSAANTLLDGALKNL